jgi:hypothetical protein
MTKTNSMEDITGKKVTDIPADFLVNFENLLPLPMTDQVMDIDIKRNGSSDDFHDTVEGKITPSSEANMRIKSKTLANDFTDSINIETRPNITIKIPSPPIGAPHTNIIDSEKEGQRLSTDSGIAIQEINDMATHGNSTENSLTEMPQRDHPSNGTHLSLRSFDSLKYGTKRARESMLLSQLCVVSVVLPADIYQGQQKGRGAMLKFRFSPYTQIETLRVAILKVTRDDIEFIFLWKLMF